ncbi:MAG: 16S rRNA (adenine(1518)-N(6)/adenine(1519)-N(6))-dimethyltransferase RsmA [Dehalococcoidales bacterium]|nr:16S rRNA (adenine(1518)-N(6)/adenine(1519)-N(6))-dimethyltransferase RsmA [Dehalococcoidales bacterium]
MPSESLLARTKKLLLMHDLRARKGLGQNFLIDETVVDCILSAAELTKQDTVIEVGPGLGVMTDELAKLAGKVIAVELDDRLAGILADRFTNNKNVTIINRDILETDPAALLLTSGVKTYKVVANLPYYITSAVIRHFLEAKIQPARLVLMTQKEVAGQITAPPGKMSLLSVSVQLYGEPKIMAVVPAASFYPAPNVDSAVLRIDVDPAAETGITDIAEFFMLAKAGFSANRKQIVNPLAQRLAMPRADVLALLENAGIDSHRRAETLTIPEWKTLYNTYRSRERS